MSSLQCAVALLGRGRLHPFAVHTLVGLLGIEEHPANNTTASAHKPTTNFIVFSDWLGRRGGDLS